jgi:hypothetical protein
MQLYRIPKMTDNLDDVHRLRLKVPQCFGDWICFGYQVEKRDGEPTVVRHVESAIICHMTVPETSFLKVLPGSTVED